MVERCCHLLPRPPNFGGQQPFAKEPVVTDLDLVHQNAQLVLRSVKTNSEMSPPFPLTRSTRVQDPVGCVDGIVKLLRTFGTLSGYKLNIAQTLCFPVNQLAKSIPSGALPFDLWL